MSELNAFGAILTYAIDMEARLRDYYSAAGAEEHAREAEKRRITLERVRRENVTEIKLEPITGLHAADYVLNLADLSEAGQRQAAQIAAQFYTDVVPHFNVREAQRALERCSKQYRDYLSTG